MGEPVEAVREASERLAAGCAIVLQPENREVLYAPPLSAVPTPFVAHSVGRSYFAPCAWDALGAPAMLGGDADIEPRAAAAGKRWRSRSAAGS